MSKAVLINSSPRKGGNTAAMLAEVASVLEAAGVETETLRIAGKPFRGCMACGACKRNKDGRCVQVDEISDAIGKAMEADALLIGSPTYFADLTAEAKAFVDRFGYVARANDFAMARKVGAAVIAARRAGSIHAMDSVNHMFLVNKMIVPGSSYWTMAQARDAGEYEKDDEGVQTMKDLGEAVAWLLEKTAG